MSRKHSRYGWVNKITTPKGNGLRSHSGGVVNEEKRTLGNDLIVAHSYSHKLDLSRYRNEQRQKQDDALWADTMRMLDEINEAHGIETVNSVYTSEKGE